jgi:hypothetical protein
MKLKSFCKMKFSMSAPRQAPAFPSGHFYIRKSPANVISGKRAISDWILTDVLPGFGSLGHKPKGDRALLSPAMSPGIFLPEKKRQLNHKHY